MVLLNISLREWIFMGLDNNVNTLPITKDIVFSDAIMYAIAKNNTVKIGYL
mgnify:CR=1 FL=1